MLDPGVQPVAKFVTVLPESKPHALAEAACILLWRSDKFIICPAGAFEKLLLRAHTVGKGDDKSPPDINRLRPDSVSLSNGGAVDAGRAR